jgi:hypothetical protein
MRDLVSYHRFGCRTIRMTYWRIRQTPNAAEMLQEIAEEESRQALRRAYQNYAKQTPPQIVTHLLGARKNPQRRATILFFAWHLGKSESDLETWLQQNRIPTKGLDLVKLYHAYSNPRLGLTDYAFLLGMHPLDLWCATQFRNDPNLPWKNFTRRALKRAAWRQPGCSVAVIAARRIYVCASAWKKMPLSV